MTVQEEKTRVAVAGAAGRMGRKVLETLLDTPGVTLTGALTLPEESWVGLDVGPLLGRETTGVSATGDPARAFQDAQVVIDFSSPQGLLSFLPLLREKRIPLVSGITGLEQDHVAGLDSLAREVPVLWAPNMSLGANLLAALARQAARRLGQGFDLEILELHHRHKQDAPSGTALHLAQVASQARGVDDPHVTLRPRGTIGARGGVDEVGVGVLRGGDVVGEHTVYFFGAGERVEIAHRVVDRTAFARGAVRAAQWLVHRPPGRYSMAHVLDLE